MWTLLLLHVIFWFGSVLILLPCDNGLLIKNKVYHINRWLSRFWPAKSSKYNCLVLNFISIGSSLSTNHRHQLPRKKLPMRSRIIFPCIIFYKKLLSNWAATSFFFKNLCWLGFLFLFFFFCLCWVERRFLIIIICS